MGGEVGREKAVTQSITLTLEPVLLDEHGAPTEFLIDTVDSGAGRHTEVPLDGRS